MKFRLSSLQMRLAARLAALYVFATTLAIAALVYEAYDTAGTLNNRDLQLRAADLARYVQTEKFPNRVFTGGSRDRHSAAFDAKRLVDELAVMNRT